MRENSAEKGAIAKIGSIKMRSGGRGWGGRELHKEAREASSSAGLG